ncbi:MAG TPA: hypothetical protein VNN22_16175 [Verrucomicrobiae bacterium]|nr:hypothetical protein [Verrucomicrobiae bacterium]
MATEKNTEVQTVSTQDNSDSIKALETQLSQEEQQDKVVLESKELIFDEIDADKLRARELEYTDVEKHFVRKNAWLKVAKELAPGVRSYYARGLRYLTLPGFNRLDVALLRKENLLAVDPLDADKIYVAGFETDPAKYGRMASRNPKFKLFGNCSVEAALTDHQNPYYTELLGLFPFDIINLDLTTSLTPQKEGPYSTTMQAINNVFRQQAGYPLPWSLFLTFRNVPTDWERRALQQLCENLQKNISDYPSVRDAFVKRYNELNVADLQKKDAKLCISQSVIKWLVDRAHSFDIHLKDYHCYEYQRYSDGLPPYTICKQVMTFSKGEVSIAVLPMKDTPREAWMQEDLVKCINRHKPQDVEDKLYSISIQRSTIFDEVKNEISELCRIDQP